MKPKTMAAGEFKAKCLAVMDEVRNKRTPVTITKNGKPVVRMVPIIDEDQPDPIFGFLRGKAKIVGDITAPLFSDEEYEEFFEQEAAKYNPIEAKRR
ncbi:MAG: type II toxin-antitoxin system Phd/YefM family antitoxin [Acidobacteriaceae bacterium]